MTANEDHARGVAELYDIARRLRRAAEGAAADDNVAAALAAIAADLTGAAELLYGRPGSTPQGQGAKKKILAYFLEHVGEDVSGRQLAAVSGIQEWARRVRELRVEDGYDIVERGGSTYRLLRVEPDLERARRWQLANAIRRQPGSALERIEAFLVALEGEIVNREQIDYVARIQEGSRRIRELRDEHGLPISSHIDEPELRPGEYRLVSADPADRRDPRQRIYPEGLRERVFARDHYTCQDCHRTREAAAAAGDSRFYLEIHHKQAVAEDLDGLTPDELSREENLLTLCHRCHGNETRKLQERLRNERRKPPG